MELISPNKEEAISELRENGDRAVAVNSFFQQLKCCSRGWLLPEMGQNINRLAPLDVIGQLGVRLRLRFYFIGNGQGLSSILSSHGAGCVNDGTTLQTDSV
jgi:hypothetical protein